MHDIDLAIHQTDTDSRKPKCKECLKHFHFLIDVRKRITNKPEDAKMAISEAIKKK